MNCRGSINVNGDVRLLGGQAEKFDIQYDSVEPGSVVVINSSGKLVQTRDPYYEKVVGVVSDAGNYKPGMILDKKESSDGTRIPVALIGIP